MCEGSLSREHCKHTVYNTSNHIVSFLSIANARDTGMLLIIIIMRQSP